MTSFTGKGLAAEQDLLHAEIDLEHARIEAIQERFNAAKLTSLNAYLLDLVDPILQADDETKSARANLTYGDLIASTSKLLKDPGAAWVLYKLDGGIDHLLLDEVQDTAPAQWKIAEAIAEEFFAGEGARNLPVDQPRSIFAVGDAKQSIFSFQGADLESFEAYRGKFRSRVQNAGQSWLDGELSVSFRSTAPVLQLVDAVFSLSGAQSGVCPAGHQLSHGVSREGQAGSVALWPLAQAAAAPKLPAWTVPDNYATAVTAKAVLARDVAQYIKGMLEGKKTLPSRQRPITPGDILILVRHRDELVTALTRELKLRQIPVAGLDRMVLTEQQAVSDLLALCDCLLLPEDDLAFGQFLASPLGGLTDESLMHLAIGRTGTLSSRLAANRGQQPDWLAAHSFFEALRNRVDFITPYALLAEALGSLGGRARLLLRLGPEAGEPIDELLADALSYSGREPASLQNFVFSLRQSGAQIKREAEAGGDVVRIMTVHGAKGLQAPVVVMPDTTGLPNPRENLFWLHPPQQPNTTVPIFCPNKELRSQAVQAAFVENKAAQMAEQNRLLYVALTRAEDELIVCGAETKKALPENCWYESIRLGFNQLAIPATEDGKRLYATPQTSAPDRVSSSKSCFTAAMPDWAGSVPNWHATPPRAESTRPEPLAPSRNTEDAAKLAVAASPLDDRLAAAGNAREAALAKGRMVHALLQYLPDLPASERAAGRNPLSPAYGGRSEHRRAISDHRDGSENPRRSGPEAVVRTGLARRSPPRRRGRRH